MNAFKHHERLRFTVPILRLVSSFCLPLTLLIATCVASPVLAVEEAQAANGSAKQYSKTERRDEQERLRGPAEFEGRDERGAPALQPTSSGVLEHIAFGPMQADSEGYFKAPTTAPVGSRVPVEITYEDRHRFDNLILVRADEPDAALNNPSGRNMHQIGEQDTLYRRAGDEPGLYEIRLRRHMGRDRRIMARQQIEILDLNIGLQVPSAVAARAPFDVHMNPVLDGHLVITAADRDLDSLVSRNARRNNAIEHTDGPGVFTRTAPRSTGEYEVRFHFNPAARIGESTGREGRLMARATLNVVDADSLPPAKPEAGTPTVTKPEPGPAPEPHTDPVHEPADETEPPDPVNETGYPGQPQPQDLTEDCVGFNPRNLEIQPFADRGARLLDGSHALMAFSSRDDAEAAVQVIRHYGFNRSCYVGRPNPSMHYFLVDGKAPHGDMRGEDCIAIDPDQIEAAQARGSWKLIEDNHWLMDFGESEEQARQALSVVRHHRFTHSCFVARPDPALTYLRR